MTKKMKIHYVATECFPMAKVGGLADVVGSLPKYLNRQNCEVSVFIPRYQMPWFEGKLFQEVYASWYEMPHEHVGYRVGKLLDHEHLGYDLYVIDIPGKLDRTGVYSDKDGKYFYDEAERYTAFQRAYLYYLMFTQDKADVVHCHDHHTGLIPFMMRFCYDMQSISHIPTVFTIHNERYQGVFGWEKRYLLPAFDSVVGGFLEWAGVINPLASAVKCAWAVTTVSPSYMEELRYNSYGLEWLFNNEYHKCTGILNGIDHDVWNPSTDPMLEHRLDTDISDFKNQNKAFLLRGTQVDPFKPVISFIGRFAGEKGADLLPSIIEKAIFAGLDFTFVVLGTGDKAVEQGVSDLAARMPHRILAKIAYDEKVSHQIYAGSDFLIMPSRVEPCGLNQMYALRYGTIPIVHNLGGLKDSIQTYDGEFGNGLKFYKLQMEDILGILKLAQDLYYHPEHLHKVRTNGMLQDFSWDASSARYIQLYQRLIP